MAWISGRLPYPAASVEQEDGSKAAFAAELRKQPALAMGGALLESRTNIAKNAIAFARRLLGSRHGPGGWLNFFDTPSCPPNRAGT